MKRFVAVPSVFAFLLISFGSNGQVTAETKTVAAAGQATTSTSAKAPVFHLYGKDFFPVQPSEDSRAFFAAKFGSPHETKPANPCVAMMESAMIRAELQFLEDNEFPTDPALLSNAPTIPDDALNTSALEEMNRRMGKTLALKDAYTAQYGDDPPTSASIQEFYAKNQDLPAVKESDLDEVAMQLFAHRDQEALDQARKLFPITRESFLQGLAKQQELDAKRATFRAKLMADQRVTDADVQRFKKSDSWNSPADIFPSTEEYLSKQKEELVLKLFLLEKVEQDAKIYQPEQFKRCVEEWRKEILGPLKKNFPDAKAPIFEKIK